MGRLQSICPCWLPCSEIHTFRRIIINLVWRCKYRFSILNIYNTDCTVGRNLSMPEIFLILVYIVKDSSAGTAVAGNQNGLILIAAWLEQPLKKGSCTNAEICYTFSILSILKVEGILIKILKMLWGNLKIMFPASQSLPGTKADFANPGILKNCLLYTSPSPRDA